MIARAPGGSLRWRLLRTAGVAAVLVIAFTGLLTYFQASHEAEELMDGHLAQEARLILALIKNQDLNPADLRQRLESVESASRGVYEPKIEFQIGDETGTIVL
ncbi:MAG: hypothetical protein RI884_932, partial [Pseudomonadota bacterium]